MKTVSYNTVLYRAAELAGRTRDKLPLVEATMLQTFFAADLVEVWNSQAWPELVPAPEQVSVTDRKFSKREGTATEMGDIVGCWTANPLSTTRFRAVEFEETDGEVRIAESLESVWVEYLKPAQDLLSGEPSGATIPERFANYLALRGAGHLLRADGQTAAGDEMLALAEQALAAQVRRLVPVPRREAPRARRAWL